MGRELPSLCGKPLAKNGILVPNMGRMKMHSFYYM
jgi:hypothetical protein